MDKCGIAILGVVVSYIVILGTGVMLDLGMNIW